MLKLYNTLTRKKEEFIPIKKGEVRIYVCGPTVNDVPHLGHAKQQVSFDLLRRFLIFLGYKVKYVSNITDIEDKIIAQANKEGISIKELSKKNEIAHKEDYKKLNILTPDIQPHATEYVEKMIDLVKRLEEKGYTYTIKKDGVYFDISKFKDYGKLSNQKIENLEEGKRVKVNLDKKNFQDFVLWKFSKTNEPSWESPWGKGRPGWHIECSTMSYSILGLPLDIHGGGQDLIFPHHEDEIAQSEAGYGKKFANYWIHNGLVNIEGEKMSKSLNNFKTIQELLKIYEPMTIRYFIISTHYRKSSDFSKTALDNSKNSYEKLKKATLNLMDDGKINKDYLDKFRKALLDDLNTPKAFAVLWSILKDNKAIGKYQTIKEIDSVLGLDLLKKEDKIKLTKEQEKLIKEREEARKNKDWKKSDEIREKLKKEGIEVQDSSNGVIIKKI